MILLDVSPSPRLGIGNTFFDIIQELLSTLAPTDYFTILAGNSTLSPILLPGSGSNVRNATKHFLPSLNFIQVHQQELMRRAFQSLNESRAAQTDSGKAASAKCQSAIIVITDREMEQTIPLLAQQLNANFTRTHGGGASVKIFINSIVTPPNTSGATERSITCASGGIWNSFHSTTIYEGVNGYYRMLARSLHVTEPVWSDFGTAFPGYVRNGTSLCLPAYNRMGLGYRGLLGVSCIILPLMEVESLEPGRGREVSPMSGLGKVQSS